MTTTPPRCFIEDETGCTVISIPRHCHPSPGDKVEVLCCRKRRYDYDKQLYATKLSIIGKGTIAKPIKLRLDEINDRKHDLCLIETEGLVVDIIPDDVDLRFDVFLLKDKLSQIPLFIQTTATNAMWLGARIRVTGTYNRLASGFRHFSGNYMVCDHSDIQTITPPQSDESVPAIDPINFMTPTEVAMMDKRALEGTVLASWGHNMLMLGISNVNVNVSLSSGQPLPPFGSYIRVVGFPESDHFNLNLVKARWKLLSGRAPRYEEPASVDIGEIIKRLGSKSAIDYRYHGKLISLSGVVQNRPSEENFDQRLHIDVNGHSVSVDASNCPELLHTIVPGCSVEVTGRCIMENSALRRYDIFPRVTGFAVILRTANDLKIVKAAPWWTPNRMLGLIIVLTALLVGVLAWNRLLNRLIERRGRQLYRADIARATEALRVDERTRLAVELHDSLSQNLTGVALQIKAGRHDLAAQALKSCREELRNCLWDLRNNAIDCDNMDEAIRQTLAPHAEDITLNVRFNVPRKALSDNTAYTILRIIRELVTNAVRHGRASTVRVAGSLEPNRLLFSVRDNGVGFDPATRLGIDEGHFGLQGVEERVATLGGEVLIESEIANGTKITVIIPISPLHQTKA